MTNQDTPKPGQMVDMVESQTPSNASAGEDSPSSRRAVALGYDREEDDAPRVLASGKGVVADQILSLAFANGIRVRKDEDLVEVLSKVELEETVPLEAFTAVAEILSYVYRANSIYGKPKTSEELNKSPRKVVDHEPDGY